MRVVNCTQRSAEWFAIRMGRVTASNICHALDFLKKGGESQKRKDYKTQLIAEILTDRVQDNFQSPAMMWGIDHEDDARRLYEERTGCQVVQVGFVLHPTIDRSGCSPDGLIGLDGGVDFKCPNSTTHLDYIKADVVPEEYQPQLLWNMVCCEREWWDVASFDPRFPEHLQLFTKRLLRDEKRIAEMEQGVLQFLSEVDDILARLPRPDGTRPDLVPVLEKSLQQVQGL